jgi:hypothetical protein
MAGKNRRKWILVVVAWLLLTFFSNPNQAQHLKAIQKRVSKKRFTTADNQVSQLLAVFDYDFGRLSSDIWLLRYSSHDRQNIVLYGSGRSTEINGGNVTTVPATFEPKLSNSNPN